MSATYFEDLDFDAAENDDGDLSGEDYGNESMDFPEWEDGDDTEDDEASRASQRRRRARARRVALARQRRIQARARAGGKRGAPVRAPRSAVAAIQAVDLQAKVADDSLRAEITALRKASTRATYAAVSGLAVNQFIESFKQPENPYAKAALRFAPALLLTSPRRRPGIEGWATDPRVLGGAALAGITFFSERRASAKIDIASVSALAQGKSARFSAQVLSPGGQLLAKSISWRTSDNELATVDPKTGEVTANSKGRTGGVFVIAEVDGFPPESKVLEIS